jgi:hypothetical protein
VEFALLAKSTAGSSMRTPTVLFSTGGFCTIAPYFRGFGPKQFRERSTPRSGQLSALGSDVIELAQAFEVIAWLAH